MILSNLSLLEALDDGRLVIQPEPARPTVGSDSRSPFGTTSVDLTLGATLQEFTDDLSMRVDFSRGEVASTLRRIASMVTIDPRQGYTLEQGKLVLAQTAEQVTLRLPDELDHPASERPCLAARIEGKSSRARFGLLIHFTAPTIHAGWSGPITLEMINLGPVPIVLAAGMSICQLIVEEVAGKPLAAPSQFHGQVTPDGRPTT